MEHFHAVEGEDDGAAAGGGNSTRRKATTASALRQPADSARTHSTDQNRITMYEAREAASADLFAVRASMMAERELPLEKRHKDAAPQVAVQSQSSVRAAEEAAFVEMEAGCATIACCVVSCSL